MLQASRHVYLARDYLLASLPAPLVDLLSGDRAQDLGDPFVILAAPVWVFVKLLLQVSYLAPTQTSLQFLAFGKLLTHRHVEEVKIVE